MVHGNNALIFSVFQTNVTYLENVQNHREAIRYLDQLEIGHLTLTGRFEGNEEASIVIRGFENRAVVEHLCARFKQVCYMETHHDRATFLVFPDGTTKPVGNLEAVSQTEAKKHGSYSYNPVTDLYFVAK